MARNKVISALVWIVCLMSVKVSHLDSTTSCCQWVEMCPGPPPLLHSSHLSLFWLFLASGSPCERGQCRDYKVERETKAIVQSREFIGKHKTQFHTSTLYIQHRVLPMWPVLNLAIENLLSQWGRFNVTDLVVKPKVKVGPGIRASGPWRGRRSALLHGAGRVWLIWLCVHIP